MLRILKYLSKAEIGQMLIALVTIVGQVFFDLKLPDYMSDITTLVETPGSAMSDIWIAGGKMLLISLGSVACAIVTGYISARVGSSFTQRLRSLEFRKVESYGPAEMSKFSTASLITRSTNDITQIQMFITIGLQRRSWPYGPYARSPAKVSNGLSPPASPSSSCSSPSSS